MHLNGKSSLKAIRSHWVGPWFSAPFLSTSISRKKRTNHDFLHLCCLLCLLAREVVKNFIKKYSVNSFIHVNVRQSLVHYNCTNRCPYVHQHVCYCNTFKALFAMINPTTFFLNCIHISYCPPTALELVYFVVHTHGKAIPGKNVIMKAIEVNTNGI